MSRLIPFLYCIPEISFDSRIRIVFDRLSFLCNSHPKNNDSKYKKYCNCTYTDIDTARNLRYNADHDCSEE